MKAVRATILALAALGLASVSAAAQVPREYAAQLAQQLAHAEQAFRQMGFTRAAGPFAGGLAQRGARALPVTLRAGHSYRILGVCDADCSDLDLRLIDQNGGVIAVDVAPDDVPILDATPRVTGQHTIEVSMRRCATAPCYFAVNVYAR